MPPMKLATADFTRVSILSRRRAAAERAGGGGRAEAQRGACRLRRARGARAAGPLGRAAPGAQCCRGPSPGLPCSLAPPPPPLPATLPQPGDMERAGGSEDTARAPGAAGGCSGRLGVRGAEPTPRARGPAAPAATATAVESCDNQAARAPAAALAQAQPLPSRPSPASSETVTSGGRPSLAWSVPGKEDGGAVRWWLYRC